MADFVKFVLAPAGLRGASLAISGSRAGGVGVVNGELENDFAVVLGELEFLATHARGSLRPEARCARTGSDRRSAAFRSARSSLADPRPRVAVGVRRRHRRAAARRPQGPGRGAHARRGRGAARDLVDGLLLKGNEAGGFVGEDSSFILLQKWLGRTGLPLYLRGGLTPHVAAACSAVGVAGGVLDSQLLLHGRGRAAGGAAHPARQSLGQRNGRGRRRRARRVLPHPGSPRPCGRALAGRAWRRPRLRRAAAAGRRRGDGLERSGHRPPADRPGRLLRRPVAKAVPACRGRAAGDRQRDRRAPARRGRSPADLRGCAAGASR